MERAVRASPRAAPRPRVGFYFPERLTPALLESDLSDQRKAELRARPAAGKLRSVSVRFGPRRGIDDVLALIALKRTLR